MRISVALCTYNGARFLEQQLKSITAQSVLPDELVVCDDCSTDHTMQLIEEFARTAPFRVRIYQNSTTRGVTRNFEQAIRLCEGDLIVLSDQDDVWYPHKLQTVEEAIACSSSDVIFSDADLVDSQLKSIRLRLWQAVDFTRSEQAKIQQGKALSVLLKHQVVTGATMAFHAKLREFALPIPGTWVHDGWIALIGAVMGRISLVPHPLICYRQHSTNQIGVPPDAGSHLAEIYDVFSGKLKNRAEQFASAHARIAALPNVPNKDWVLACIRAKHEHVLSRAISRSNPPRRIIVLLREMVMLRYFFYSLGWKSFIKDLLVTIR